MGNNNQKVAQEKDLGSIKEKKLKNCSSCISIFLYSSILDNLFKCYTYNCGIFILSVNQYEYICITIEKSLG